MNLHDDSFQDWEMNLMILVMRIRKETLHIVEYLFTFTLHPYINVARHAHQGIGVHQGIPLPLQHTTPKTFLAECFHGKCRPVEHLFISVGNLGDSCHPLHHIIVRRFVLPTGNALHPVEDNPDNALFLRKVKEVMPTNILHTVWDCLILTNAKPQKL